MESFGIELGKTFRFNSSHFIIYPGFRGPMHSHNFKVSIKIKANNLNSQKYVIDFGIVKRIMKKICDELKHKCLLPKNNKCLTIEKVEDEKLKIIIK